LKLESFTKPGGLPYSVIHDLSPLREDFAITDRFTESSHLDRLRMNQVEVDEVAITQCSSGLALRPCLI
jgi:hypothetical protein